MVIKKARKSHKSIKKKITSKKNKCSKKKCNKRKKQLRLKSKQLGGRFKIKSSTSDVNELWYNTEIGNYINGFVKRQREREQFEREHRKTEKVKVNIEADNKKVVVITRNFNALRPLLIYALNKELISEDEYKLLDSYYRDIDGSANNPYIKFMRNSICEHIQYRLWLEFGNAMFNAPKGVVNSIFNINIISGDTSGDESIKACARREVREEIGFDIAEKAIVSLERRNKTNYTNVDMLVARKIINAIEKDSQHRVANLKIRYDTNLKIRYDPDGYKKHIFYDGFDDQGLAGNLILFNKNLEDFLKTLRITKQGFETIGDFVIDVKKFNKDTFINVLNDYLRMNSSKFDESMTHELNETIKNILAIYIELLSNLTKNDNSYYDRYQYEVNNHIVT